MIQVVAHFHDLRKALSSAAAATRPGGLWLIETWDRQSLTARILGRRWHEFNPPSVLHWFTPESLSKLVSSMGLAEVARGKAGKRISAKHAKSVVQRSAQESMMIRCLMPFVRLVPEDWNLKYPGDDLFWVIYRKPPL